jgi:hypothetical protein
MYRPMIGSLLYLTPSRPHIIQVVGLVGRFQDNPKETHVLSVKRIFRYLQGTIDYELWYPKDRVIVLISYIYVDGARNIDDRKNH